MGISRTAAANQLYAVSYISIVLEFLFALLVYLPLILESQLFNRLLFDEGATPDANIVMQQSIGSTLPPGYIIVLLSLLFLATIGYVIFRLYVPALIHKTDNLVDETAIKLTQFETKKTKIQTPADKRIKNQQNRLFVQLGLIVLPVIMTVLPVSIVEPVSLLLLRMAILSLAIIAVICVVSATLIGKAPRSSKKG